MARYARSRLPHLGVQYVLPLLYINQVKYSTPSISTRDDH